VLKRPPSLLKIGQTDFGKKIASIAKSLASRMQWGRAAAGMEAVGALSGVLSDSINV
jgi:hypothetical protein